MLKVSSHAIPNQLSDLITRVEENAERIVIEQGGKEIAALISYQDLERLENLEDQFDSALLAQAVAESDEDALNLESVLALRGLTRQELDE
jgi:prevent-host-death family protein